MNDRALIKAKANNKNHYSTRFLAAMLIIIVSCLPSFAMAQDPGGCPDCPIDGGLGLLLVAGVGYGAKKYWHMKKPVKDNA
jgi:hypothetical protein